MSREKSSRLVRVLLVRAMGVLALYALYQTATLALSPKTSQLVSFGLGMISLVLLFMGIFMTFGKIEKEEVISDKSQYQDIWDEGFKNGYAKAQADMVENEQCKASGLPSTIED